MSRVRLTNRRQAVDDSIPYPGNVNQPDRKDKKWDQYHTFEQQTNHELPDMRHEWKEDERDEVGFGIPEAWGMKPNVPGGFNAPTVASVRLAANKAVRIAVLLLGEKVSEDVIEAQARDLMSLTAENMDRTLSRFADTQSMYAEDEKTEDKEEVKDEKKASEAEFTPATKPGGEVLPENKSASEDLSNKAQAEADKDKKAADEKKDEKKDEEVATEKAKCGADEKKDEKDEKDAMKASIVAMVQEALKAAMPEFIQKKIDEKDEKKEDKKDEKKAADEKTEKTEEKVEEKKAAEEKVEEKDEKVEKKASTEMDIELTATMDEVEPDSAADAQLASLFEDSNVTAAVELTKREGSQKAGIKKLGGQPRVAGTSGAAVTDIASIWETAPDVSEVFR